MSPRSNASDILRTGLAGAAAGVVAAAITSLFQSAWKDARLPPTDNQPQPAPPTEILAERLCRAATGRPLPARAKAAAGTAVHLLVGAALGSAYGQLLRRSPDVEAASGIAYGLGVWATVEEVGLWLLRLKPAPWRVEPAEHLFAASSHVVFGFALNASLKALGEPRQGVDIRLAGACGGWRRPKSRPQAPQPAR